LIVKETTNLYDIKAVLCHPVIYDTISDDTCCAVKDFEPPISNEYQYIAGYVDNEIIGVLVYHSYLDGRECHVQVLPKYRKEHAKEFGEQALMFKGTLPLYAEIPDLYQNVLDYALLNGFVIAGVKYNCYIKNGIDYPVNILKYKG